MLGINNIEDFVSKLGLIDVKFNIIQKDSFGDLIVAYDPDVEYKKIRKAIMDNRDTRNNIVDSGLKFYEITETLYIEGYKTVVAVLCEEGSNGMGTVIKMMVKHIEYPIGSEIKSFLSFESLKNYLNRLSTQE